MIEIPNKTNFIIQKEIKEIDYTKTEEEILCADFYKDIYFCVRYTGSHPCCYLALEKSKYDIKRILKLLYVYGGITCEDFSFMHEILQINEDYYILGWDYGHSFDFKSYLLKENIWLDEFKEHNIKQLILDCKDAIKEIHIINKTEIKRS